MSRPNLHVLIVDDEPLARQRLKDLLAEEEGVEIIGECADGATAVKSIRKLKPDLVFLDVQMPGLDGFEVLEALDSAELPAIIFSTAHDHHAIRAFEVNAIDYLHKPFSRERMAQAVAKVRERASSHATDPGVSSLREQLRVGSGAGCVLVRAANRILFVRPNEIDLVESAGNYVVLHCGEERHIVRDTLSSLATRLEPSGFMRISRSAIINLARLSELEVLDAGQYRVVMKSGARCDMTCPLRELEARLNELPHGKS